MTGREAIPRLGEHHTTIGGGRACRGASQQRGPHVTWFNLDPKKVPMDPRATFVSPPRQPSALSVVSFLS
jgi:hypothetical protein